MKTLRGLYRRHPRAMIAITLFVFIVIVGGVSNALSGHPATRVVHDPYNGPTPSVTVTAAPSVTPTVTVTHRPAPPLSRFTGTGDWKSGTFKITGPVKVHYVYWNNSSLGSPDNFMLDLTGGADDNMVANTIAASGDVTTNVYPDISFSGTNMYHLEIQATGSWSVTVTPES